MANKAHSSAVILLRLSILNECNEVKTVKGIGFLVSFHGYVDKTVKAR